MSKFYTSSLVLLDHPERMGNELGMTDAATWSHLFKPEVRNQGAQLFGEDAVFLQIKADTQIQAIVKGKSRVHFAASSIAARLFTADCNCASAGRGQLCKHIWATLLAVQKNHPDFLDSKKEIVKVTKPKIEKPLSEAAQLREELHREKMQNLKLKQAEYRKQQYQKQKQRLKDKKSKTFEPEYPSNVADALQFFSENGFTFDTPLQTTDISEARKSLARIFHPDRGGSHAEAVTLNGNFEILMKWATTNKS